MKAIGSSGLLNVVQQEQKLKFQILGVVVKEKWDGEKEKHQKCAFFTKVFKLIKKYIKCYTFSLFTFSTFSRT